MLYDCLNAASLPLERLRYESSVCLALTQPERDLGRVSQFFCQPSGFAELRAAGKSPPALIQASSRFKIIQHGEARLLAIGG